MKKITLKEASVLTSPNPFTLICTCTADNKTNLAAVSWWSYLSFHPETVGFAMSKASFSGERIRETGKVILAMPGSEIAQKAKACGTVSGRNSNKTDQFNIDMQKIASSEIQIPICCRAALICSLQQTVEVGDHLLYICSVDEAYGDDTKAPVFAWNGYADVRPMD